MDNYSSDSDDESDTKEYSYRHSFSKDPQESGNEVDNSSDNERKQRFDSYTSEDDEARPSLNRSTSESLNFYSNQQSYEESYDYGKKRTLSCTSEDEPEYKRKKLQSESTTDSPVPSDSEQAGSYFEQGMYAPSRSDDQQNQIEYGRRKFASESTDSPVPSDTEPSTTSMMDPNQYSMNNDTDQDSDNQNAKSRYEPQMYSNKALKMMKMMGYKEDTGLGKSGQGRVEPIEASMQKGRRGLGLKLDDLDAAAVKWDPTIEKLYIPEIVELLENPGDEFELENQYDMDTLSNWVRRDSRKLTIENESKFCDENILQRVLESKSVFDNLGSEDMRKARTRSNPFETIRGNIFLNRAAVKMANMDSMFDFMFTNPVDRNGNPLVGEDDLLYFADVCAGPGGFSEYVLWRKKWEAKGYGFTLKQENDFKLEDFFAGHPETFHPYYGINEDGNVFDPENIESLTNLVMNETETGVHFMMADGGFSVEGQENIQEILSKQLYLAQCLVALSILRTKGHFVVKLFDLFTPFSVSLLYLMYKSFEQICICKPNTSRPANSERYLVCKWKKPHTQNIQRHLFEINKEMWDNKDSNIDIAELVPLNVIQRDKLFFEYVYNSNNLIGKNQIVGLLKVAAYCHNTELLERKQSEIRKQCLELWKLPDDSRHRPNKRSNEQYYAELLGSKWHKEKFLNAPEIFLENCQKTNNTIHSVLDWHFVGLDVIQESGKNVRTFFMSKGKSDVCMFAPMQNAWTNVRDISLEISPETLIYGEIVKELIKEGKSQVVMNSLHIIDAIVLGGKDIRQLPLEKRNKICQKFAKALNKPPPCAVNQNAPIRCKRLFKMCDLERFFDVLIPRKLKDGTEKLGYNVSFNDAERFYIPRGLLFMDEVRSDKMRCLTRQGNRIYYFDKRTKKASFPEQLPDMEKFASFKNTYTNRLIWKWERKEQIEECLDHTTSNTNLLYRQDLMHLIHSKLNSKN